MIQLYNDDCINVMKNIEDNSIDCILTDPPYGVNFDKIKNDNKDLVLDNMPKLFTEFYRLLKDNSSLFLFVGIKNIHKWIQSGEDAGFTFKNMIATRSFNNGSVPNKYNFAFNMQPILFFSKGKVLLNEVDFFKTSTTWLNDKRNKNKKEYTYVYSNFINSDVCYGSEILSTKSLHPNQKNLRLTEFLLKISTQENDTIMDCFMGSGTTGVASIKNNRNFIGIEIDKNYFNIAKERIERI